MTDVSSTRRKSMSPSRRLKIFEQHQGKCALCGNKIDGVHEKWTVEHLVALGLSGSDDDANCAPAHESCRREKDRVDLAMIAKAKRNKVRHLGITHPVAKIKSPGFAKSERAANRQAKPSLPPRSLFTPEERT